MSFSTPGVSETIALRGRRDIEFEAEGFRHPRSGRDRRGTFTRYAEITHVALSDRMLWLAKRRAAWVLPRSLFADADGAARLVRSLMARIARLPGGSAQLSHMARVEALSRRPARRRATLGLAALCLLGFLLDLLGGPDVSTVGSFSPALVADGDWWRVVTGTLLHGFPLHFVLNLAGLLILGRLAERSLGGVRTVCVMAASGLAAMGASGVLIEGPVVGVSGVVFGLAGAVLWLELWRGDELPAWWRFPQPLMGFVLLALALDVSLGFFVPFIAGEAHLGGFVAGALATALLCPRGGLGQPARPAVRWVAIAALAGSALAVSAAAVELLRGGDFAARHAARLASLPNVSADELNNHAWYLAISEEPTRAQLEAALLLAERAVAQTDGQEAALLDTLAEVQFRLGRAERAIATIDLAIEREPAEPYYREQRRCFTGERDPDDCPPAPTFGLPGELRTILPDEEGIRV